jgi:hypothetical protein
MRYNNYNYQRFINGVEERESTSAEKQFDKAFEIAPAEATVKKTQEPAADTAVQDWDLWRKDYGRQIL